MMELKWTKGSTSSGSFSHLWSIEKVQSRYLSPHMASCHDFCKHGKKHNSEAEERRLNFRKFTKRNSTPDKKQYHVTSPDLGERKTRTAKTPEATTKIENKVVAKIEDVKPQTPLASMKDCFATDKKKSIQMSFDNEKLEVISPNPGDGKKAKKTNEPGTQYLESKFCPIKLHDIELNGGLLPDCDVNSSGEPQTALASMKDCNATDEQKTIQLLLDNEQTKVKTPSPGEGKEAEKNIREETQYLQSKLCPVEPKTIELNGGLSPDCDMNTSGGPNYITEKQPTKSPASKPIRSVAPKVIKKKSPTSTTKPRSIQQKVPLPSKKVDVAGKVAISLKTKTPLLIRSFSQLKSSPSIAPIRNQEGNEIARSHRPSIIGDRKVLQPRRGPLSLKSSRNLIARRNQDINKMDKGHVLTSEIGERKLLLKPTMTSFSRASADQVSVAELRKLRRTTMRTSSTPHDYISNLHSRKLKSTKQTTVPHDTVPHLQPRKLKSMKRTSLTLDDTVSNLQPRSSTKQTSLTPHDTVSNLQLRKLRSIRQTWKFFGHDSVSSLYQRKLRTSVKPTASPLHSYSSTLPSRKLRKVDWASSMNDRDNADKPKMDSNSGNINLDPNQNKEGSESSISVASNEEVKAIDMTGVKKDDDKRRWQISETARTEDNNTPTPFKLKFRKGKVINLRSDSIGARRRWFNIGMMGTEKPNGNGLLWRKKNIRRKGDIDSLDSSTPSSEVQSVVLKHQGVSGKKDGQSLLNHVIEQTASKLVETRKSKVKALVGAFETLISLQ